MHLMVGVPGAFLYFFLKLAQSLLAIVVATLLLNIDSETRGVP